jgi:hypothetical protein
MSEILYTVVVIALRYDCVVLYSKALQLMLQLKITFKQMNQQFREKFETKGLNYINSK